MTETKSLVSFYDESIWSCSKIIKFDDILRWRKEHHLKENAQLTDKEWESMFKSAIPELYELIDREVVDKEFVDAYPFEVYRDLSSKDVLINYRPTAINNDWSFLFRAKSADWAVAYIMENYEITLQNFYKFNQLNEDTRNLFINYSLDKRLPIIMKNKEWMRHYNICLAKDVIKKDEEAKSEEVKKEPEKPRIDPNLKMKVESVMDLVGIAAEFDWEGVFDLEKKQGFFDEVDCTELEEKRCAIEQFREKTLENIIHFVLNCEREGHKERFEEFWHSLRVEYYDGKVILRYQPIVYDNYD